MADSSPADNLSPKAVQEQLPSPDAQGAEHQLSLRSLVSTKEAGIIIGKSGATIAAIRDSTGVKAGVSKVVQGVQDRVLSVTGDLEGVASAYAEVARLLLETPLSDSSLPPPPVGSFTSIRLLISHNLMGTVIGRSGLKIKQIQDMSGARMVASKEMLPQSTERVVEVQGSVDAIKTAVLEIGKCLLEDWDRGAGTVLYHPGAAGDAGVLAGGLGAQAVTGSTGGIRRTSVAAGFGGYSGDRRPSRGGSISGPSGVPSERKPNEGPQVNLNDPNLRTQNISIPSDMVGCIIGRGGSKITEIRRLSGSRISIAKVPHDETGERMFTIQGTPEATERALMLLYSQLESEKERRVNGSGSDAPASADFA
ncbi:cytoplasmic protein [Cryptococcus deuterogattii 99/473]|uniref:Cytoplasmic protein n=1 Tax=Cryptococcus deuterogattii Ram5 TaxID=1296110 RepID=A0A0D0U3T3_9TREE|nr:cytoplasmic protein [Cryptococcus deuterogattii LA55]KIR36219.1 cytoplasmic protein [Cryptococcus deuterogattii MMRL2647]KIR42823.1 cytoplasmic protein [Cryptococcus deuterogattii Ram5]KIR75651.1 cytoplasmic protein [Cryptococcus deuterogattii CA1014]KIR95591.1 cytoplasmic protein [Cryptococcus deuterogattii CBS 10090]KIS02087.1 cytoplasmic protein [Cryptococcus deuterogattii 2001/935-1]KIY59504.1 cytoplasmic protein [Cryptococcus deuterogattii 99/473]KNX50202.2 cytoplasmic protein [Crypt